MSYISPFTVSPECYKVLAEDDDWYTGLLTMEVGAEDAYHHHRDHLIYVLEGDGVTIYPGGDKEAAMAVPLAPGAGIPAPMAAPPFVRLAHAQEHGDEDPQDGLLRGQEVGRRAQWCLTSPHTFRAQRGAAR